MNRGVLWFGFVMVLGSAATVSAGLATVDVGTTVPPKAFGYDIFHGQVQEVTEGPVDEDYLIGPRDELLIETWGQYTQRYPVQVSEDGYIDLEGEGLRIYVNGLTLRQVKEDVLRNFAQIHQAYFDPKNPKAWISVKPMRVRRILVYVAGEVKRPGTFSISSTVASLINVLTNAGGISPSGSLRHLRISRADGRVDNYDLYDFLIRGDTAPVQARLKYGETIFVDLKRKSVCIEGPVRRPGVYEMIEGESLSDLIEFAGGPAPGAYLRRLQVIRRAINEGTQILDVDFARLEDESTTFALFDGDHVQILPSVEEENVVYIEGGGIYRPGIFQFTEGMTLDDLIEKGEGLRGEAYLEKVDLIRTGIDKRKQYIQISLQELYRKNLETGLVERIGDKSNPANRPLQRLDKIVVYSHFEITGRDKQVELKGHVKEPGQYLLAENMMLSDVLFAHGGFDDLDWRRATYLERADLIRTLAEDLSTTIIPIPLRHVLEGAAGADLALESQDTIIVYSFDEIKNKDKLVTLDGHVKQPGEHPLSKNMRLSDLFFAYGGFEDEDFRKSAYLERANLFRTNADGAVQVIPIDLRGVLRRDPKADILLQSLDRIVVYEFSDFYPDSHFSISGAVRRPGRYVLARNATLNDAIVMAHGLLDEAYKYEAEIVRISPAQVSVGEPAEVLRVPISGNFATEPHEKGFPLSKDDAIFIRTVPGWERPREVMVEGEVKFPGAYVLAKAEERLSDLVKRAGGLKETAYAAGAVFLRLVGDTPPPGDSRRVIINLARAVERPGSEFDLILRDGDSLRVPIHPMTVEVRGAVQAPATVLYRAGKGIRYYVELCGGFRGDAERSRTLVQNPDGTTTRRGLTWFAPRPLPGSVIIVPPLAFGEREGAVRAVPVSGSSYEPTGFPGTEAGSVVRAGPMPTIGEEPLPPLFPLVERSVPPPLATSPGSSDGATSRPVTESTLPPELPIP